MKYQYHEGPKALDNFNKGMTKLFQASKRVMKEKPKPKAKLKKASKD